MPELREHTITSVDDLKDNLPEITAQGETFITINRKNVAFKCYGDAAMYLKNSIHLGTQKLDI